MSGVGMLRCTGLDNDSCSNHQRTIREPLRKRSQRTWAGLPLVDVAYGPDAETGEKTGKAHGIIAVGNEAEGWLALGGRARGVVALGGSAVGGIALGGTARGIIALGGVAVGGLALGGVAIGLAALGGAAVGGIAVGGGALGYLAVGGAAVGKHVYSGAGPIGRKDKAGGKALPTQRPTLHHSRGQHK